MRTRELDVRRARVAKRHGMQNSLRILLEARKYDLSASLALGLITQETTNGANVFGHDPTIFIGAGKVTKSKYLRYKRQRGSRGQGGMQGVGPPQLTYYTFQDAADKLGGCWKPKYSIRVGFQDLAHLIKVCHGDVRLSLAIYNGGAKNPNFHYADSVLRHTDLWHSRLNRARLA